VTVHAGRLLSVTLSMALAAGALVATEDEFLSWPPERCEQLGRSMYARGRVGRWLDTRLLKTERSHNYKLAATWLTPEVIRATARLLQINGRLNDAEARQLVEEADTAGDTVVLVEIDPREGSGVIPLDWSAFLEFVGPGVPASAPIRGTIKPELRHVRALTGVLRRNYDYDRFWVVFPLAGADGSAIPASATEARLSVRIYDREGRVDWPIPPSVRQRANQLSDP
jgi:hypothetical protein